MSHRFDPTILREYDVRGIVGETLSEADALALGRAFGSVVAGRSQGGAVAVGYDGRLTSPALEEALCQGLAACGLEALRIGRGPTPMLYFAVHHLGAAAGMMITGSHNPPDHNGFKMMLGSGPFYGEQIQELGNLAASGECVQWVAGNGNGGGNGERGPEEGVLGEEKLRRLMERLTASAKALVECEEGTEDRVERAEGGRVRV